jgi:hypothetical protein
LEAFKVNAELNEASVVRLPTGRRMRHPSAIIHDNPYNRSQKDIAIMQLELLVDIREILFSILCGKTLSEEGHTIDVKTGVADALTGKPTLTIAGGA